MTTTRLATGLGNVPKTYGMRDLPMQYPAVTHSFFTDFDLFTAADWTITETQAGATQALVAGDGGFLALVNSAANADLNAIQKTFASFRMAAGKRAWFETRLKVDDATNAAFVAGLQVIDTTPLAVSDGIFFSKAAATTTLTGIVEKTSTITTGNVGTMVSDTYAIMSWYYNGTDSVEFFFNNALTLRLAVTNLPNTVDITPSFAVSNGTAAARTMTIDYVFAAKAR